MDFSITWRAWLIILLAVTLLFSWTVSDTFPIIVGGVVIVDVPDIVAFKAEGFKGAETWLCTGKSSALSLLVFLPSSFLRKMFRQMKSGISRWQWYTHLTNVVNEQFRAHQSGSIYVMENTHSPRRPTLATKNILQTSQKPIMKRLQIYTERAVETFKLMILSSPIFVLSQWSKGWKRWESTLKRSWMATLQWLSSWPSGGYDCWLTFVSWEF